MKIPNAVFDIAVQGGGYQTDGYHPDYGFAGNHYQIALDPSFWRSLVKGLGYDVERVEPYRNYAHQRGLAFCELTLTGGDADKFWGELLDNKM
jgi:hypothetical protein